MALNFKQQVINLISNSKELQDSQQERSVEELSELSLHQILTDNLGFNAAIPIAVSTTARYAAEPMSIFTQLFKTIPVPESTGQPSYELMFPSFGGLDNITEIGPGMEYNTENITWGKGTNVRAEIRKYGIKLSFPEEIAKMTSAFDIMDLWIKEAGYAFARTKNRVCFNIMDRVATTVIDNANQSNSVLGRPLSGRGADGKFNGSFSHEDFFDIYAAMLQEGFSPKVILMHPLTWGIWAKDPVLKVWAFRNGMGPLYNAYNLDGVKREGFGGLGMSSAAHPSEQMPIDFSGSPVLPDYLNLNIKIVVSPQVPFNPVTRKTNIYFLDTDSTGVIFQAENIKHFEWADPERDIQNVKLRERYGVALLNEGRGVFVVKNVPVTPNRFADFGVTNLTMSLAELKSANNNILAPEQMKPGLITID